MNRFLKETIIRELVLPNTWQDPGENAGLGFRVERRADCRVTLETYKDCKGYSPTSLRNMAFWFNELAEALEVADQ